MGFGLKLAGNTGRWGPVTSTLDWCEENYIVSEYIAEFWNSTSNAVYLALCAFAIRSFIKLGITESRPYWSMAGFAIVGLGSFCFHGSLLFHTQMMDELPMIYCSCVLVFANLRVFPETNKDNNVLFAALTAYSIVVTATYLYVINPVFHQVSYGLLVSILTFLPPVQFYHIKNNYPQYSNRIEGLWKIYWYDIISYLGGFFLWNVDNNICESLRAIRKEVGYPLRVLFELHVWWHVGTGIGSYAAVVMVTYMRCLATGRDDIELRWAGGIFPVLISRLNEKQIADLAKSEQKKTA
ncbi:Alkaline ceramidase 3 [Physocladia obscura]|uniref:Alkaline ceramidase 3 n=1 Tax=Physocladia obscura TaxID=109957 RepID=A0AAD5T731_9FUNG|nr:Alkaline ceramidase 3 [Physocladia obscura]